MPTIAIVFLFILILVAILTAGRVLTSIFANRHHSAPFWANDDAKVQMLEKENAALIRQLTAVHDRLETLERIVTDKPSRLEAEIDALKTLSDHRTEEGKA